MMEGKRQAKRRKIGSKSPEASDETHGDERQIRAAAGAPPPPGDSTVPGSCATPGSSGVLNGVCAFILQAGIVKTRMQIFKNNLNKFGGEYLENYDPNKATHIIVDDNMTIERMCNILKVSDIPSSIKVVKSMWLISCVKQKEHVKTEQFELVSTVKATTDVQDSQSEISPVFDGSKKDSTVNKTLISQSVIDSPSTSKQETQSKSGTACESNPEEINKYRKVGMMWGFRKKKRVAEDVASNGSSEADSDYVASGEEDADEENQDMHPGPDLISVATHSRPLPRGHWACAQAPNQQKVNHNKHITDKLEGLAKAYETINDRWRALGYQKAISALKRHPKPISSFEEAKALPGVGDKLAEKIWEIIESGDLRKLHEVTGSADMQTLDLFMGVWGAGAATARTWVQQGFRTLDDLREKANLTRNQKIGLQHYDDLLDRMPREEAAQIEQKVKDAALSINPGLVAMACGSFRRGKATCGDVDVLITHPDGKSHKGVFSAILTKLRQSGFITDDLVTQEDNGNQKKYLGVCRLPGPDAKHRRLDIIVVPYDEFACALLYFTGSAHLNRSMRHLAGKMGMSLSEHSLNVGVVRRKGEKLNKGTPLPTPTEESVFKHLGIPYKTPEERDI